MKCRRINYSGKTYTVVDEPIDAGENFVTRHIMQAKSDEYVCTVSASEPCLDSIKNMLKKNK